MNDDYLIHYGVLGMKWGVRKDKKNYKSTSLKAKLAQRSNDKVDQGFKNWKEGASNRDSAISAGKKMNASKRAYESNKNKTTKAQYKSDKKAYKEAYKKNTTYRKGVVKQEVKRDAARKYLSDAKKVKKQLDSDPSNKSLQKQYNKLMSNHDTERASARRAKETATNRSRRIAVAKRKTTVAIKGAAGAAAIAAGAAAVSHVANKNGVKINSSAVKKTIEAGAKVVNFAKKYVG